MSSSKNKSFQLPLDLSLNRSFNNDNFLRTESNLNAYKWIDKWPNWPSHVVNLYGPSGCGKTHLAHIFCNNSGALYLDINLLDTIDPFYLSFYNKCIVIDNIENINNENILFNLFNSIKDEEGYLLLLGRLPPSRWMINLPDLKSRLLSIPSIEILSPDEISLKKILIDKCKNHALVLSEEAANYAIIRIPRTFIAINRLADEINLVSLSQKKKLSLSIVKEAIKSCKFEEE